MASKLTYASATTIVLAYAKEHGFDNSEVIGKVEKLIASKSTSGATRAKSPKRKENESLARDIIRAMAEKGIRRIDNRWVVDNIDGIANARKAVAVLNVCTDMGWLCKSTVPVSATRNKFVFDVVVPKEEQSGDNTEEVAD